MTDEHNPQAEQMAHESMVRNLAAQANAIWPQEETLFARYGLAGDLRIADIGCGSGEITSRLARLYPRARPEVPHARPSGAGRQRRLSAPKGGGV